MDKEFDIVAAEKGINEVHLQNRAFKKGNLIQIKYSNYCMIWIKKILVLNVPYLVKYIIR